MTKNSLAFVTAFQILAKHFLPINVALYEYMNQSYKELRKRQIIQGVISLIAVASWSIIVDQSGGFLDDYLILGIVVIGLISVLAIICVRPPILCNHCEADVTEVFAKAEILNKSVKCCPFCGSKFE